MSNEFELLALSAPVGKGQENRPDDVARFDNSLRRIGEYDPPPEYADGPQRYATESVIDALDRFQEKNGLKIDGIVNPGGPTERAINNRILNKPRGVGLMFDPPPAIGDNVGNGMANEARDVASVKRRLGALDYLPEDPFDAPSGIITEATTSGIKRFQLDNGLGADGWMAPGGETERALEKSVSHLAQANVATWLNFAKVARPPESSGQPLVPQTLEGADEVAEDGIVPVRTLPGPPLPPPRPVPQPPRPSDSRPGPLHRPDWRPSELRPESIGRRMDPRDILGRRNPSENSQPPTVGDIYRALGVPPETPLEEEARRALVIPRKTDDFSSRTYLPEPGSPLRIPVIDIHHYGPAGRPDTQQTTKDMVDAIEKACKEALKDTGAQFERIFEHRYRNPEDKRHGSYRADGLVRMTIGKIVVDFIADTYTPKADGFPDTGEASRYLKLKPNIRKDNEVHGFVVRVPKPWALGHVLDKEGLSAAVKEICDEIRRKLDKGEFDPDKDKVFWDKILNNLTKPRPKPKPEEPREPETQQ